MSNIAAKVAMIMAQMGMRSMTKEPRRAFAAVTGRSSNPYGKVGSGKRRRRRNKARA